MHSASTNPFIPPLNNDPVVEPPAPFSPPLKSPAPHDVPLTRVERVDDAPRYGEVPNTEAYAKRRADAVPDEVEVIPDGHRSRSSSMVGSRGQRTPRGASIPRTVIDKADDGARYGEVPGTDAFAKRRADASPDEVRLVPQGPASPEGEYVTRPCTLAQTDDKNPRIR
jgi:hypothetical protein